jgi:hypothetical protein
LPDFAVSTAGFVAAGFGAALAGLFGNALRALASGADGFDFAATFFVFDAALAMAYRSSARGGGDCAPYTTFCRFHARRGTGFGPYM